MNAMTNAELVLGTPLSRLIEARCERLNLGQEDLLRALGYRDLAKGKRRLAAFRKGEGLKGIDHLIKPLARALRVEDFVIRAAIYETEAILRREERARYAASFRPHAILKTENTIPRPIFSAAVCRADKWRVVEFDAGLSPVLYVDKVLSDLPEGLPFWGRVLGFWINYTPDRCVEFDRAGHPVKVLDQAVRVGTAIARPNASSPLAQ